jgi:hypothetical protein
MSASFIFQQAVSAGPFLIAIIVPLMLGAITLGVIHLDTHGKVSAEARSKRPF